MNMLMLCNYEPPFFVEYLAEQTENCQRSKLNETSLHTAKAHIAEITRQRDDLERRLTQTNAALRQHLDRETQALQKVQEVLQVADAAIAEKEAAQKRALEVRDECDHLATTIGQVMQEASTRCEQDMAERQARNAETVATLEKHIVQVRVCLRIDLSLLDGSHKPAMS